MLGLEYLYERQPPYETSWTPEKTLVDSETRPETPEPFPDDDQDEETITEGADADGNAKEVSKILENVKVNGLVQH